MLRKSTLVALVSLLCTMGATWAGTFGQVVPIGGAVGDVALDEARGRLYIANFTANRIEVMSLASKSIQTSINVAAQPSSLSVSPDGRWLLASHYGKNTAPASPTNGLTLIDLSNGNAKQTFALTNPPLGLAFGVDGKALVVTTKEFLMFDPVAGTTVLLRTIQEEATKAFPVPQQTFPPEITQASVGASADRRVIWGFGDTLLFQYDAAAHTLISTTYGASPTLGPRAVSVSNDGTRAALGWWMMDLDRNFPRIYANFGEPLGNLARGGHAIDGARNLVYSEVPFLQNDPAVLTVRDADNLTVRQRLSLPEHLAGRALLSADGNVMYAASDSGVLVMPVGNLNSVPRLESSVEDLVFRGNFCDRDTASQTFTLRDPSGARVPFTITSSNPGVTITPSSGVTPAVIKVTVDPNVFAAQKGTVTVNLTVNSSTAVNILEPIRVLINSREPDQRGTFVNVPGKLVDLVADPERDQYYALRQDQNQLLVFDGSNNTMRATLRTCNTPTGMAITYDRRLMLVTCENAQIISVFDLDTLQSQPAINAQNTRLFSIAASARAILAVGQDTGNSEVAVFKVNLANRVATRLPSTGVWENILPDLTVATAAPNGASILFASPNGGILIYDANVDNFTVSRKDFQSLSGAYAASAFGDYVVGNNLLNSSGVPVRTIQPTTGKSGGFTFVDGNGFFIAAPDQTSAGVISRVTTATGLGIRPTRIVEAPVLSSDTQPFTRTLAALNSRGTILALTVSGITVLPPAYDASVASPVISRIVSAADGVSSVAPGGLFTIFGTNLSPTNVATKEIPLPTALGDSCLTVNGQPVPVLFVSPGQVNAQMPYQTVGNVTMIVHTPGGVSDNFNLTVPPSAPSVFRAAVAPGEVFPTIVRTANNLMVTDTNPVRRNEVVVIYLTGMGRVSPNVEDGRPAPSSPLATTVTTPEVTIGGIGAPVLFSGLTPGLVGLYQINISIPGNAPKGLGIPLNIVQNGVTHTINVRVVD